MALLQVATNVGRSHSLYARSDSELANFDLKNIKPAKSLHNIKEQRIVTLNVGGQIFKTYVDTLLRVKSSRLTSIARRALNVQSNCCDQEYFFDRNPDVFAAIIDYCRFNKLHLPKNICSLYIRNELEFWGISESDISKCCQKAYFDNIDDLRVNENLALEFAALKPKQTTKSQSCKERIYDVLYYPETSVIAKIWAVVYYILVIVTVFNIFLSTVPECRVPLETNVKVRMLVTTEAAPAIQYIDLFCVFYFTIEFFARVITVPSLCRMFRQFFTFCDLLYLIPVWVLYIVQWSDEKFWRQPENIVVFLLLECCIVARVVALFRVANHYRGLRVLVLSLRASLGELFLLFVFIIFGMVVFSSLIYCVEIFIVGNFENMFYGLWWSLITMTTVGYGDTVPKSGFGYLVACICAMTGIILIGMIVPIITNNFHKYYEFRQCLNDPGPGVGEELPTFIESSPRSEERKPSGNKTAPSPE
ncbi:hypothetical protein LOTGIDRAFT_226490 [Lottia gigantea]|uniref:BTB domain-containing protein n=1 Tax=Lottia gigantea TaxID=225164 RepID=V4CA65_LOTGI|nr:hypothetical protein LOTGIDRAFT_226490 [Lottia gigantea]ESO98689.1 hypothetical protein LOTGIDRAFT_226490 [Lottia gigantea]